MWEVPTRVDRELVAIRVVGIITDQFWVELNAVLAIEAELVVEVFEVPPEEERFLAVFFELFLLLFQGEYFVLFLALALLVGRLQGI